MPDWLRLTQLDGRPLHVRGSAGVAWAPLTADPARGSEVYLADADVAPFVVRETAGEICELMGVRG